MKCVVDAWQKHEAELRGYLLRQMHDPRLTEDLLQDTFIKAITEGERFCLLQSPRAWLFHVARNQLIDQMRRRRSFTAPVADIPDEEPEIAAVDSLTACLPRVLTELSAEDADVIRACDLGNLTQAEYAKQKGLSLPGVKSRLQRARLRLKQHLKTACQVQFDDTGEVCCFVPRPAIMAPAIK